MAKAVLEKTNAKHKFFLGGYSVEFMEEVGKEIDFLILDTVHSMPGEFLDYLAWLPYLKDGAVVVLHDVALNEISMKHKEAFATKILLDAVLGEKIYQMNPEQNMITIGAFRTTQQTKKDVLNVFAALHMNWRYMPNDDEIALYRECYKKYYDGFCMNMFESAVTTNKILDSQRKNHIDNEKKLLLEWANFIEKIKKVNLPIYVYGKGKVSNELTNIMNSMGVNIYKYIVSDEEIEKYNKDNNVVALSGVSKDAFIIVGVSDTYQLIIQNKLQQNEYNNFIGLDTSVSEALLQI